MISIGLKEPIIQEGENSVVVIIRHELLASAEETIMNYLEECGSIGNSKAREICHIPRDYAVKIIFGKMVKNNLIEQIPGTNTSSTAYRIKKD